MEKHKCKLCPRSFSNGRALGGHMKAHLAALPLPPKIPLYHHHHQQQQQQLGDCTDSTSSSGEEREVEDGKIGEVDRESETESKNPTRRRSKRTRKIFTTSQQSQEDQNTKVKKPSCSESPTEPEPVSSVSDTSPEEDVAMCLMMLSRDVWMRNNEEEEEEEGDGNGKKRCPFCFKVFGSGQALGGHKRSHLLPSSTTAAAATATVTHSAKFDNGLIDLNLPAPLEEDDYSVVSDA
ncbi:hypothetical protein Pint_15864 [Pistacia integerrima]|uniref:Uncharacterized protein n=1 Tax=Pistacia integerrima TaxID=434235 RepID=A0ACC0ZEB3_9ROSI|nr:hypothetical protein Pint_15864 [Pistacia integerrima]